MQHHGTEVDLDKIKTLAELRKDENLRFKTFLKAQNAHKTDLLVHKLNEEIAPKIDCTTCGNCCKQLSPCITKPDLHNLCKALNLTPHEVAEQYTEMHGNDLSLKFPCKFLKDNKCSIYAQRPESCSSFPHLHKDKFTSRLRPTIENYGICPIIFNVIEQLKEKTGFNRRL